MNLPDLRRRQRIVMPITQMIVVRPDDHVFIRLARQIRQHVVHGRALGFDMHVERQPHAVGKRKRFRLGRRVNLVLHVAKRFSRRRKPFLRHGVLHLHQHDAGILRPADAP
jgi:hypothetical protein